MSAASDLMRVLVPPCAGETDDTLNMLLSLAAQRLDSGFWGAQYTAACCYLAGHIYVTGQRMTEQSGAGATSSESAGGQSRSYAQVPGRMADAALLTTSPGRELVQLRNEMGPAAAMSVLGWDMAP